MGHHVQARVLRAGVGGEEVPDRVGDGRGPAIFQGFDLQPAGDRRHPWPGLQGLSSERNHMVVSFAVVVCDRMTTALPAQTRAPGRCRAGGGLAWR